MSKPIISNSNLKRAGTSSLENRSIKDTTSNITQFSKKEKPKTQSNSNVSNILVKNNNPGYGLWCTNTDTKNLTKGVVSVDELERKLAKLESQNKQNLNADVETNFDKRIIGQLKQQLYDITSKFDNVLIKYSESEYKAERAEANRKTYFEVIFINIIYSKYPILSLYIF